MRASVSSWARSAVSGVRSSWPASAAKRRVASSARSVAALDALQAREHLVQRARERAHLLRAGVVGERGREVLGVADARGARAQPVERADRERGEAPGGQRGQRERGQAEQQHEVADAPDAVVDRRERAQHLQPRVAGLRDGEGQRAPRLAGDVDRLEAVVLGHPGRVVGHVAGLLDHLTAVGHLREGTAALEQRLRAAAVAVGVAARRAAQDRRGALAQLDVDLVAPVALDRREQQCAGEQPAHADRGDRGERDPRAQAARRSHGRSAHPTPRTVCRIRGSPPLSSLRRR